MMRTNKRNANGILTEHELAVRLQELFNGQNCRTVITTCIGVAALVTVSGAAASGARPPDLDDMNADIEMLVGKLVAVLTRYMATRDSAGEDEMDDEG